MVWQDPKPLRIVIDGPAQVWCELPKKNKYRQGNLSPDPTSEERERYYRDQRGRATDQREEGEEEEDDNDQLPELKCVEENSVEMVD